MFKILNVFASGGAGGGRRSGGAATTAGGGRRNDTRRGARAGQNPLPGQRAGRRGVRTAQTGPMM